MSKAHEKTVKFEVEKLTKNTVKFAEVLETEMDVPVIGSLYVQKTALKDIGFIGEGPIYVVISTEPK